MPPHHQRRRNLLKRSARRRRECKASRRARPLRAPKFQPVINRRRSPVPVAPAAASGKVSATSGQRRSPKPGGVTGSEANRSGCRIESLLLRLRQNPRPRNPRPRRRNLRLRPTQHRRQRWLNSSIARFSPTSRRDAAKDSAWARPVSRMTPSDSLNCAWRKPTAAGSKKSRAGATSGACSIYRRVSIIGSTAGFSFMCRFRFCF